MGEAAQSFYGFQIQLARMLYHLIKADPDDVVWLEKFDDVGVSKASGNTFIEQDASSLSRNLLSERSEKVWKTLSNWVDGAKLNWYDVSTSRFLLYTPQAHRPSAIVAALNDAVDPPAARRCLLRARNVLGKTNSDNLRKWIENIIDNSEYSEQIIINFKFQSGSLSEEELLAAAISWLPGVGQARGKHYCRNALGWLSQLCEQKLSGGQLVEVAKSEFKHYSDGYIRSNLTSDFLASISQDHSTEALATIAQLGPVFVRQLLLLKWEQTDILREINCYLRTREDLTGWAIEGEITEEQVRGYENALLRTFMLKKLGLPREGLSAEEIGRKLATTCLDLNAPFHGRNVEPHLTPGVFHHLANGADRQEYDLGWHPLFRQLLKLA